MGKVFVEDINHTRLAFLCLILRTLEHSVFYSNKPYINQMCLSWFFFSLELKFLRDLKRNLEENNELASGLTQCTQVTDADSQSNCADDIKEQTKLYTCPVEQELLCVRRWAFSSDTMSMCLLKGLLDMKLSNNKFFKKKKSSSDSFAYFPHCKLDSSVHITVCTALSL